MQFHEQVLRTTSAAQNLLLAQALQPDNPTFVVGQFLRLSGPLDVDRLVRAIDSTLGVLDVASARFRLDESGASMVLGHEVPATRIVDVSGEESPEQAAREWAQSTHAVAIDPATQPCVRTTILILDPQTHLFHLAAHHVALDAFGIALLMRRISDSYGTGKVAAVSSAALMDEDESYRCSADFDVDREFWARELRGAPAAGTLARDDRPHRESSTVAAAVRTVRILLPATTVDAMKDCASVVGVNWSEVLSAGIAGFVARATDRDDVILGFLIMARMGTAASRIPTTSVNVVPLRVAVSRATTVLEVVEGFRQARARIARHSRYRGEDVLRALRSAGSQPVVGPSVNIKPFGQRLRFAGLDATVESLARGPVTDLSITAQLIERSGEVELVVDADAERYTSGDLAAIAERLREFVGRFASSGPNVTLGHLPTVTAAEAAMLSISGPTRVDGDTDVLQSIRWAADAHPDAPAILSAETTLRYDELIDEVDRLAARLRLLGVGPGDTVALLLPRTPALAVALLATLAAGAAYIPLDPRFPADRLEHMLGHSRPRTILTTGEFVGLLSDVHAARALALDSLDDTDSRSDGGSVDLPVRAPDSTAYVIYTSGSTGLPKGVAIGDRAMSNLVRDMSSRFGFGPATIMLAVTTISFDIAVLELFAPLVTGGRVVLAGTADVQDPHALAALIDREGVNVLQATPALWSGLLAADDIDLRGVDALVGGEPLPDAVATELVARARSVWNMYGPTETTVWSTVAAVSAAGDVTIGTPISNTRTHVLDAALQPVPVGSIGELYIAGTGVAAGYVGRSALTATRFVAEPGRQGARMYRTGDLARRRPDGRLDCLGRTDDQVKVRGFRVELGDVETAVAALAGIGRCVARVVPTATGGRLLAYVQADLGTGVDPMALREMLRDRLPDYMIPAAIVEVAHFPQTPNGKLDRNALPEPDFGAMIVSGGAPVTDVETTLCAVFADVLDLPGVGIDDDFFALGGDSIAAVRVVGAAARQGLAISVAHVFDARTVAALAGYSVVQDPPVDGGSPMSPLATGTRVLPETAMLAGLSQDELDEFEGEGSFL